MVRPSHPKKEVEEALRHAEGQGWRVEVGGSHAWGRMYCPYNDEECRCGEFCIAVPAEQHAEQDVAMVAIVGKTHGDGDHLFVMLLRKAFADDHILPDDILWRQKAAFSDAVGHSMVDDLKAYAESLYSDEAFGRGCEKYTFAKPFTKESLLYRDIFEKYYPGQADMVKDFWMPNKAWKGCDVKDPSARVLSNYGASGK